MGYLRELKWEIVPENLPVVKRNCPKCNEKTNFINSKKFRVNANKNNIDVWLIYQCEKCKSTWNMTIFERTNPNNIDREQYDMFAGNDENLAEKYGFNIDIHSKNKAELILTGVNYKVIETTMNETNSKGEGEKDETIIEIKSEYPCRVRMDKLLADNLGISRSKIRNMYEEGYLFAEDNKDVLKSKVKDNIKVHIVC